MGMKSIQESSLLQECVLKEPTQNQTMVLEKQALCKSRAINSFTKVPSEIKLHEEIHTPIILLKHSISSFILIFKMKVIKVGTAYSGLNI